MVGYYVMSFIYMQLAANLLVLAVNNASEICAQGERGRWTDLQLEVALKDVKEQGLSISWTSGKFGLPKTTLYNHYTGKSLKKN